MFFDLSIPSSTRRLCLDEASGLFIDHRDHRFVKKQDLTLVRTRQAVVGTGSVKRAGLKSALP